MTIADGIKNAVYIVSCINAEESVTRRLGALGINEGTKIQLINQKRNGSLIFKVRGTRWAVGKDIANGIEVEEYANENN